MNRSYRKTGALVLTDRKVGYESNPARALAHNPMIGMGVLMIGHVFLAFLLRSSSILSTAHGLVTLTIGIFLALFGKDLRRTGYLVGYIVGAEVLWRMTSAHIFWEAGKYFTAIILGIALLRLRPWQRAGGILLFFGLLMLSIPLTLTRLGSSSDARDSLSFYLSGPFALMVSALYFSQVTFDEEMMRKMAWWIMMPILSIATLVLSGIMSAGSIQFSDQSNITTSGGFGPNQVSAVLGLGGGLALLLFLTGKNNLSRWVAIFFAGGFLSISALTFSRGGLYNVGIMLVLAIVHSLKSTRGRVGAILLLLILGLVGGYLVFPRLNSFTDGMLSQRFMDQRLTGRDRIANADLEIFLANPVLGVGPGMAKTDRLAIIGFGGASHTEYTRLLAEHGTAGLLALLLLLFIAFSAYMRAPNVTTQIWVVSLLAWPFLEMSHSDMRIAAISFLFGLSLVNWETSVVGMDKYGQ